MNQNRQGDLMAKVVYGAIQQAHQPAGWGKGCFTLVLERFISGSAVPSSGLAGKEQGESTIGTQGWPGAGARAA